MKKEVNVCRLIKMKYPIGPHTPLRNGIVNKVKLKAFSINELLNYDKHHKLTNNEAINKIILKCSRSKSNTNILRSQETQPMMKTSSLHLPKLQIKHNKNLSQMNIPHVSNSTKAKRKKIETSLNKSMGTISTTNNGTTMNRNKSMSDLSNKTSIVRVKGYSILSKKGKNIKCMKNMYQKNNFDNIIAKNELISNVLGTISLFCITSGHGEYGNEISRCLKKFMLNHFEKDNDLSASSSKDNFYTILSHSFERALESMKPSFNEGSLALSGSSCILVLLPLTSANKIYCANVGDCRCVLYSMNNSIPLSYDHKPTIPSEKERIEKSGGIVMANRVFIKGTNYPGLLNTRSIGDTIYNEIGVISEPEVIECDLVRENAKCIVIGNDALWSVLDNEEVGKVIRRYLHINDVEGANKAIVEKARSKSVKKLEEINVVVVFLTGGRN